MNPQHRAQMDFSDHHAESDSFVALTMLFLGAMATLIASLQDPLGVLHADDLTHYLYAKWAWTWPAYLLNDWGRPGFTIAYFLPAGLGWTACRILSTLLTAGCVYLAWRIAVLLDLRRAWLVIPFCYLQPMLFKLAQTTLTETPLAFYLTFSVYLALRNRWSWSAALLSVGFVTRHEAIVLLPVWVYYARREQVPLIRLWPLLCAPLAVNLLAPLVGTEPSIMRLFEPRPTLQYGQGGWMTFFSRSLEAFGPGICVLAMTGLAWIDRRRGGLLIATIAVYFACQTVIRALGLYASGGYARFLVPIGPLLAISAVGGWNALFSHGVRERVMSTWFAAGSMTLLWVSMERQLTWHDRAGDAIAELPEVHQAAAVIRIAASVIGFLAIAAVVAHSFHAQLPAWLRLLQFAVPTALTGLILLAAYSLCHPLRAPVQAMLTQETLDHLRGEGYLDRELVSASVWVDYLAGHRLPPDRPPVRELLRGAPIGSLMLWERQFAGSDDHRIPLDCLQQSSSFRLIHESPPEPYLNTPYLRVFEKTAPWLDEESPHP